MFLKKLIYECQFDIYPPKKNMIPIMIRSLKLKLSEWKLFRFWPFSCFKSNYLCKVMSSEESSWIYCCNYSAEKCSSLGDLSLLFR
jgi:hypothetical protein